MTPQSLADLNEHHVVEGASWVSGPGGPILEVKNDQCEARVSAYAAHVATWNPRIAGPDGRALSRPGLFCSPKTLWGGGKAIRGGIPVCWPWFGPRTDGPDGGDPQPLGKPSPAHGFARTRPWHVERVELADNGRVEVTFLLVSDDDTLALWPHAFEARLVASLGTTLNTTLEVKNVDDSAFDYEAALHTYLTVSDVEKVKITGLEGTQFIDKVDGGKQKHQGREALQLSGETDRVFLNTKGTIVVDDPGLGRTLRVEKSGSSATVVWNPWLVKATAMADLGGDAWRSFVCVEAANVRPAPVPLSPGATHAMSTRVVVVPARSLD
jgi:glucose-6-phosphate 1-epimerase